MKKFRLFLMLRLFLCLTGIIIGCTAKNNLPSPEKTITVKDFLGRQVQIIQNPRRVISMAPNVTEIIYALKADDCLVGVTQYCNYPPEAKSKQVMGGFSDQDINLEAVLAAKPDLIVATPTQQTPLLTKLDSYKIPVYVFIPKDLIGLMGGIRQLGTILNRQAKADSLIRSMQQEITNLQLKRIHQTPKKVFIEISATPLMTATNQTMVGQLLMLAGGLNVCGDLAGDYIQINPEFLITANPEVILVAHSAASLDEVKNRPGWQQLTAVQADAIYNGLNEDVIFRAGPRLFEGVREIRKCLYPASSSED